MPNTCSPAGSPPGKQPGQLRPNTEGLSGSGPRPGRGEGGWARTVPGGEAWMNTVQTRCRGARARQNGGLGAWLGAEIKNAPHPAGWKTRLHQQGRGTQT